MSVLGSDAQALTCLSAGRPSLACKAPPKRRRWPALLVAALAVALAADAGWLHAKAALAQVLLQRAWAQHLGDGATHRPWPWADTAPVARLRVERLGIDQIVLAGDSGRVLAFGPGLAEASAHGDARVISGHRDTHFAWLRRLADGDIVSVEDAHGARRYRVIDTTVADARTMRIGLDGETRLRLVTCWPFDALVAGGPLRYVVTLAPV